MRSIARVLSTISPALPIAPPARPVPAPRGTTGMPWALANRSVACTSPMLRASTTASGNVGATWPDLSARTSLSAASSVRTASPSSALSPSRAGTGCGASMVMSTA